mgnify:CR=1 FL=1
MGVYGKPPTAPPGTKNPKSGQTKTVGQGTTTKEGI